MDTTAYKLPVLASAKFAELADRAADLRTRALATQKRIGIIRREMQTRSPEDSAAAAAEVARLSRLMEMDQTAHRGAENLVTSLRRWIEQAQREQLLLADAPPTPSTRRRGETAQQAVNRLRDHVLQLSLRRRAVVAAISPVEELYPLVDAFVDARAREFRLRVGFLDGAVTLATEGEPKAMATAAWLHGDAMKRRLREEVDRARAASPAETMTREKRAEELARIDADTLTAEREEEQLIVAAAEDSTHIDRRPGASPMAILGVVVREREASAEPEPETTTAFVHEIASAERIRR